MQKFGEVTVMVIDASALLAVLFDEEHAAWAISQMEASNDGLCMSTVNLAETLIIVHDRQPQQVYTVEEQLLRAGIEFVAPDVEQARTAAEARLRFPINLGDCFAYALSVSRDEPILTIDRDFSRLDVAVTIPS